MDVGEGKECSVQPFRTQKREPLPKGSHADRLQVDIARRDLKDSSKYAESVGRRTQVFTLKGEKRLARKLRYILYEIHRGFFVF